MFISFNFPNPRTISLPTHCIDRSCDDLPYSLFFSRISSIPLIFPLLIQRRRLTSNYVSIREKERAQLCCLSGEFFESFMGVMNFTIFMRFFTPFSIKLYLGDPMLVFNFYMNFTQIYCNFQHFQCFPLFLQIFFAICFNIAFIVVHPGKFI